MTLTDDVASAPSRIRSISATMTLQSTADRPDTLARVAAGCKIHNTLGSKPEIHFDLEVRP